MKTVKWLRDELDKFPDDALCYTYESQDGERGGLMIIVDDEVLGGPYHWIDVDEPERMP